MQHYAHLTQLACLPVTLTLSVPTQLTAASAYALCLSLQYAADCYSHIECAHLVQLAFLPVTPALSIQAQLVLRLPAARGFGCLGLHCP